MLTVDFMGYHIMRCVTEIVACVLSSMQDCAGGTMMSSPSADERGIVGRYREGKYTALRRLNFFFAFFVRGAIMTPPEHSCFEFITTLS